MCLLSSVEFPRRVCRNEAVWFLYLVLKSFSVSPMYVLMVDFFIIIIIFFFKVCVRCDVTYPPRYRVHQVLSS